MVTFVGGSTKTEDFSGKNAKKKKKEEGRREGERKEEKEEGKTESEMRKCSEHEQHCSHWSWQQADCSLPLASCLSRPVQAFFKHKAWRCQMRGGPASALVLRRTNASIVVKSLAPLAYRKCWVDPYP